MKHVVNYFTREDKNKKETILECVKEISFEEANSCRFLNAFVFLCYRFLEKSFNDFELLKNNFEKCLNYVNSISELHIKNRWKSSVLTGYSFVYINQLGCDEYISQFLKEGCELELVKHWPPIVSNCESCVLLLICYFLTTQQYAAANDCIKRGVEIYRVAVQNFNFEGDALNFFVVKTASIFLYVISVMGNWTGARFLFFNDPPKKWQNRKDSKFLSESIKNYIKDENEGHLYNAILKIIPELASLKTEDFLLKYEGKWEEVLPKDFDVVVYEELNPDLKNQPSDWLKKHYLNSGCKEGRRYCRNWKSKLPKDFDAKSYEKLNPDLMGQTIDWLEIHYLDHGIKEGRKYL